MIRKFLNWLNRKKIEIPYKKEKEYLSSREHLLISSAEEIERIQIRIKYNRRDRDNYRARCLEIRKEKETEHDNLINKIDLVDKQIRHDRSRINRLKDDVFNKYNA